MAPLWGRNGRRGPDPQASSTRRVLYCDRYRLRLSGGPLDSGPADVIGPGPNHGGRHRGGHPRVPSVEAGHRDDLVGRGRSTSRPGGGPAAGPVAGAAQPGTWSRFHLTHLRHFHAIAGDDWRARVVRSYGSAAPRPERPTATCRASVTATRGFRKGSGAWLSRDRLSGASPAISSLAGSLCRRTCPCPAGTPVAGGRPPRRP